MLTYFQQRKLTRYFNCIDQAGKGYFTKKDVMAIAELLADARNIDRQSEIFEQIQDGILAIWDNARIYGLSQSPNRVTLSDWLVHEAAILGKEELVEGYVRKISRDVFDLMDISGKGYITMDQYCELMESFGVEKGTTEWSFKKMTHQQSSQISRHEFVTRVEEFHLSEDRKAPGNYLFGAF